MVPSKLSLKATGNCLVPDEVETALNIGQAGARCKTCAIFYSYYHPLGLLPCVKGQPSCLMGLPSCLLGHPSCLMDLTSYFP
jgi:hypothetical protein